MGFACGLKTIAIDSGANLRLKTAFHDTKSGPRFISQTWGDTKLFESQVSSVDISNFKGAQTNTVESGLIKPEGLGDHIVKKTISFGDDGYVDPPRVICFLNGFDFNQQYGLRIRVSAEEITKEGFVIKFNTWFDTEAYNVFATWIACPDSLPGKRIRLASGSFQAGDWEHQQNFLQGTYDWPFTFKQHPKVFIAVSELDFRVGGDLKLDVTYDNANQKTLSWQFRAWDKAVMNSAGISFLAWEDIDD